MPKFTQTEEPKRWTSLADEVRANEAELAGATPLREAVERARDRVLAFRCLRDGLRASSRDATQSLNAALAEGRDAESRLRSYVKGVLGPRSEKLARYGIKPLGRRRRCRRVAV
ncbi:MAG TPA: hypothetical protein VKK31_07655 [Thermoanaerobaculia bacterium]|nr:hypothetical protein [Thermoanaerobaculia bacterium]